MTTSSSNTSKTQRKNSFFRGGRIHGVQMAGTKPKNFKSTLVKLLRYLKAYKIYLFFVLFFALSSTLFTIIGPKILGMATTEVFNGVVDQFAGEHIGIDFSKIGMILSILVGIYLLSAFFSLMQGFIMTQVSNKVTFTLRENLDNKIHSLPLSYYDTTSTGDVLSRITNDVDVINQSLSQSLTQIVTSCTSILGILCMMLTISWQLTLVAVITLPVSMGFIGLVVKKSQKYFTHQQEYLGQVNGIVEENYSAHLVVKAFNGEEKALEDFNKSNDTLYNSAWKANFLSGLMMPFIGFVGNIGYVFVCILGGSYAIQNRITVGDIQAFLQYMRSFSHPIAQVSQISSIVQQTIAAAERIFNFLEENEEVMENTNALSVCKDCMLPDSKNVALTGAVCFLHVAFGYNSDTLVINDFNACINPGQKVAIVGPTGAGKTTIVKLLMRFYDVSKGSITLDSYDIRDFKRHELRSVFGMVLQDTWLYNGTIADNIRYGKLNATQEEVEEAAHLAQAHAFISTLPEGYQMVLNEEASNLSLGQKQLLTIARAVLADPKILILDEATSSVDTRTEILIQKAMDSLMEGRTSFIIAHRLSTIRNADLILVMDKGDIIEQGTHEELLEKNGFYAQLYDSQFAEE